jgi:hypothetical protein
MLMTRPVTNDRKRRNGEKGKVGFLSGVGPTVVGGAGGFMAAGSVMALESGEMGGAEQLVSESLARLGLSDSAGDLYENRLAEFLKTRTLKKFQPCNH